MTSVLTNYAGNTCWSSLFPAGTGYLALFVTPGPGPTGDLSTEVSGGGYYRQLVTIAAPTNKTIVVTEAWVFPAMPSCTVAYIGLCDSVGGAHIICADALSVPLVVEASGQLRGSAGDVAFSL